MSRSEPELWSMLRQAAAMDDGEGQRALLEDVIRHADAGGFFRAAFYARRHLAIAYSRAAQPRRAFPLFSRCLSEHDQRPDEFGPEEDQTLRHWYANVVQSMAEFPEITRDQLQQAFDDVERRFKAGGHSLHSVYDSRRWVAQLAQDWAAEERYYHLWLEAGGPDPDSVWDFEVDVERLVLRGDEASLGRAREIAAPALSQERTFDEPPVPIQALMMVPLARAGAHAEAARAYRQSSRALGYRKYRKEYAGMQIEFCALTGNEERGLVEVSCTLGEFEQFNRPTGKMEMAACVALLMRRLDEAGRGAELVRTDLDSDPTTPVATLRQQMTGIAWDLAARFDARDGTTVHSDRIKAKIAAAPVVDYLPLNPTSRRAPRATVPPGLSAEQILDRAEWHVGAVEWHAAQQHLETLPWHLSRPLDRRQTELRGILGWNAKSKRALRMAAEEHRKANEHRRSLFCRCWLARWYADNDRGRKGVSEATEAVQQLHKLGDPWAIAWGELRMAQVVHSAGKDGKCEALQRASQFAIMSGDPLVIGMTASVEAYWRNREKAAPEDVIRLAMTAKDALLAAGAHAETVSAFDELKKAHERAGTEATFAALVRWQLDNLPPHTPEAVAAYLRFERGRELLAEGNTAEAIQNLTEAVAVTSSHEIDTAEQWYHLAVACHAAQRFDEAQNAATTVAPRMIELRAAGKLDDPEMAERSWLILADSYRRLGEHEAAMEHYEYLAGKAREFGNQPILAVVLNDWAELLNAVDRDDQAAARYREAATIHSGLNQQYSAALCRCFELMSLAWSGDEEAALAGLSTAEQAVQAVPAEPAQGRASCQAQLDRAGAQIMAQVGRGPEAVKLAARSSAAFQHAGEPMAAVGMDVMQARVLLRDDRPDLAEPVLRQAHSTCERDDPGRDSIGLLLADTLSGLGREEEATSLRASITSPARTGAAQSEAVQS